MWFADWMLVEGSDHYRGPDGHCLVVRCPDGHDWNVDSIASNCDSPCKNCRVPYKDHKYETCKRYEDSRPHKCWVKSGDVRAGTVHVDKNGVTCGAGAGSIQTSKWHGFLDNGFLKLNRG
jgi:hypothetical protein